MLTNQKCPKCPEYLHHYGVNQGASYLTCKKCLTTVIHKSDLLKIFRHHPVVEQFVRVGVQQHQPTTHPCPGCHSRLLSGHFFQSQLVLEECTQCQLYVFDDEELEKLADIAEAKITKAKVKLEKSRLNPVETDQDCPICPQQRLYTFGEQRFFVFCLGCGGISSKVENIERLIGRSLFAPTMFTERSGQGFYSICRSCHHQQDIRNTKCEKCTVDLLRVNCISCSARMSEFDLHDLIIERCQFCNDVWLDCGELEQLVEILPDVRRHYKRLKRNSELTSAAVRGATQGVIMGINETRRRIMRRTGTLYTFFTLGSY
jgi:Zn-finger nucleic acid-binding protein